MFLLQLPSWVGLECWQHYNGQWCIIIFSIETIGPIVYIIFSIETIGPHLLMSSKWLTFHDRVQEHDDEHFNLIDWLSRFVNNQYHKNPNKNIQYEDSSHWNIKYYFLTKNRTKSVFCCFNYFNSVLILITFIAKALNSSLINTKQLMINEHQAVPKNVQRYKKRLAAVLAYCTALFQRQDNSLPYNVISEYVGSAYYVSSHSWPQPVGHLVLDANQSLICFICPPCAQPWHHTYIPFTGVWLLNRIIKCWTI